MFVTLATMGWTLLLSLLWFEWCFRVKAKLPNIFLPGLALAVCLVLLGHHTFGINLLFPVASLSSFAELALAAFWPALVLFVASGLMVGISRGTSLHSGHWQQKRCIVSALALGLKSPLKGLVRRATLLDSWGKALPWYFGELTVVEAVFNAPGLGNSAWRYAKMHAPAGVFQQVSLLLAVYLVCAFLSSRLAETFGKRTAGYG
jgi:ABC-type dipeptide/oligopeptide/nickel transport system permease component